MKKKSMDEAVALRHLADAVGLKWKRMLDNECDGLGHIHDLWNEMYEDMSAIACLEHYITDNAGDVSGVDFGKVIGIDD